MALTWTSAEWAGERHPRLVAGARVSHSGTRGVVVDVEPERFATGLWLTVRWDDGREQRAIAHELMLEVPACRRCGAPAVFTEVDGGQLCAADREAVLGSDRLFDGDDEEGF